MAKTPNTPEKSPLKSGNSTKRSVGKTLEVATRQNSIDFAYFGGQLPNPDTILRKLGKDMTVYEDLKADAHLGSVVSSRKSGVKSLLWEIDRGLAKSRQAKAITDHFKTMNVPGIISDIMDAPFYGLQPLEVVWEPFANGMILPQRVVGKPPEWFFFTEENELRWKSKSAPIVGEPLDKWKFLMARHNATYKNPYGEALYSRCFWPVTFKRSGVKFWITFAERYGMPWPVGKVPRNATPADFDNMTGMLEKMVQDALAAIPDDTSIEFLESGSKSASADVYRGIADWANSEMSKAIVGHGAAADSTPGKLGGEDNALAVRADLIAEDKGMVEAIFNELIAWICEINFGAVEPPKFILYEEEDVDTVLAERDKTLSDQGVEFSQEYYERSYGFQPGDIVRVGKPAAVKPPQAEKEGKGKEFAERRAPIPPPDQAALDAFADGLDPVEMKAQADGLLRPIVDMVNSAWSFAEIREKLAETYTDLDSKAIEKMLHRGIFIAELLGKANRENVKAGAADAG